MRAQSLHCNKSWRLKLRDHSASLHETGLFLQLQRRDEHDANQHLMRRWWNVLHTFIWVICLVPCPIPWHDKFWTFLRVEGNQFHVTSCWFESLKATVWNFCFAMCRGEHKSIYQLVWFIKLWKQRGCVNAKCIYCAVQIIFQTQLTLYKLDTSIICCSVMASTSDVSKKQVGDMASLAARFHGWWEGLHWVVKGPFFRAAAVLCGIGGQRGIKTSSFFQKCVYAKLKTQENRKYTNFWKIMPV